MKKLISILLFSIFVFMGNHKQIFAQLLPPYNPNYQMVFVDQFDSLHINTNNWKTNFNWGNLDFIYVQDNLGNNTDTAYSQCYNTNSERNFIFDTTNTGKISLRTQSESPPYSDLVWNYYKIDTVSIDHNNLFNGLNNPFHNIGTHRDTIFLSDILIVTQDSIYTIDSLHVVRDSTHRMYHTRYKNFNYTTAMLTSRNTYRFGYFELNFHLPHLDSNDNNQGIGPNFWLFDANDTIPWSEIDIFEIKDDSMFNFPGNYKHYHTAATHITPDTLSDRADEFKYFNQLDFCETCYNKFSVLWDDKKVTYYVNGNKIWESKNFPNRMIAMPIVIGNSVPINGINENATMPDTAMTVLPYDYIIDYVKVYQLKQYCNSDFVITTFNPDNFNYGLYKTISLGGSGSSSTIQSDKVVPLMATDEITINGTFTVELGAELTLEIQPCLPQSFTHKSLQQETLPPPNSFYKTAIPHQY